ncbi:MAG: hypothetical protein RML36_08570 [Anaerolineae bacterium]|nr:hypothetical protein [Anaerolineae bacterium]
MFTASPYLHVTNGRLRVKVLSIKGSRKEADTLKRLLQQRPGVLSVEANPITANVLILFDERITNANAILQYLVDKGYLSTPATPSQTSWRANGRLPASTGHVIANSLFEMAVEVAVQAAVRQLIGALIKAI